MLRLTCWKKDANASASKFKILRDVDRRWERRDPFYNVRTRIVFEHD